MWLFFAGFASALILVFGVPIWAFWGQETGPVMNTLEIPRFTAKPDRRAS